MHVNRMSIAILIVAGMLTMLAATRSATGQVPDATYYQVIVQGGGEPEERARRLKSYYERLLAELHVSDLGNANIGCDKCAELVAADFEQSTDYEAFQSFLTFQMKREGLQLVAFVASYHFVQAERPHDLFSLTLDGQIVTSGDCPIPKPQQCNPRPICIQTSRCDNPYGGTCQICPPNP